MSFDAKVDTIRKRTQELENKVNSLADRFLATLINDFVDRLQVKDGIIQNTPANLALLSKIDTLFLEFNAKVAAPEVAGIIKKGLEEIHGYNTDYFSTLATDQAKYGTTEKQVKKIIEDRLGFGDKTRLKPGGYMDTMFRDPTIANQIKNFTRTELIKGPGFKSFKDGLRRMIKTDANSMGAFERYYRNYAYDVFVNVDREESLLTAKALDLKYFIYSGTIIDTSREFCRKRVNEVFTTDETDTWVKDPWIQNALEKGYIASYDPIMDMGLWGCRHVPQFISKETAEALRPDLKAKTAPPAKETPREPEQPPKEKKPEFVSHETLKDAEKYATDVLGVSYANFKGLDIAVANSLNKAVFEAKQQFPELKIGGIGNAQKTNTEVKKLINEFYKSSNHYKEMVAKFGESAMEKRAKTFANDYVSAVGARTMAWSTVLEGVKIGGQYLDLSKYRGVYVSENFGKDAATIKTTIIENRKNKWFAEGSDDIDYIMTHEFGHEIDKLLDFKKSPEFDEIFLRESKLGPSSIKEKLSNYAATAGGYAKHLRDEMIAEAWAEYVTAEKPRPLAKEIGEAILKVYKQKFKK